jgi:hypothetical protein
LLPAHVINEYCHPTRPFYPLPNFKDAAALPRVRTLYDGEWFTADYAGGKLGVKFAVVRGCWAQAGGAGGGGGAVRGAVVALALCDHESIRALTSTRTAQREELITELRSRNVQRKAA